MTHDRADLGCHSARVVRETRHVQVRWQRVAGSVSRNPDTTNSRRPRWWAVALVLVLAFLGHDAAMAGDAHAAQTPDQHTTGPHRVDRYGAARLSLPHDQTPSRHDIAACAVGQRAAPRAAGDDVHPSRDALAPVIVSSDARRPPDVALRWAEPTAPPGQRRALFQVYRI